MDVSRYQSADTVTAAVAADGYEFVIINATTGLRSISSALATNTQIARTSGDLTGFYHWGQVINDLATTPDKSDPIGELAHFLADSGYKVNDILALDLEEQLGTWAQRVAYALAWLEECKVRSGSTPLLYINGDWMANLYGAATTEQRPRLLAYPLWYARPLGTPGDYGTDPKYLPSTYGFHVAVHQFSTANNLDRNWTPDLAALKALGATKEATV